MEKKIIFDKLHPIAHVDLLEDVVGVGDVTDGVVSLHRKFVIQAIKEQDKIVLDEILKIAKNNGITDMTLIDEEFVVTALKNEVERRKSCGKEIDG